MGFGEIIMQALGFNRPFAPFQGEKEADPGAPGDEGVFAGSDLSVQLSRSFHSATRWPTETSPPEP